MVAEDGRVVPVMIETDLPQTADRYVKAVHLIVDHNPDPHLAAFHLTPAIGAASITTRIKDEANDVGASDRGDQHG